MNKLQLILDDLQDSNSTANRLGKLVGENPDDDILHINLNAVLKRKKTLERQLSQELRGTSSDLIQYYVERVDSEKYPAGAVAKAILSFQELVTAVFDAIRTTPKQRYRPSTESTELSSLNLALVAPGSINVSMAIENERLLTIESDLDRTFEYVISLLNARDRGTLRHLANDVGIASISKAYFWAENSVNSGFDTRLTWSKDRREPKQITILNADALSLKEAIEAESNEVFDQFGYQCELIGIDDATSYFHIRTADSLDITGKLSDTFGRGQNWTVHAEYFAELVRITQIRYATGEERVRWLLHELLVVPAA